MKVLLSASLLAAFSLSAWAFDLADSLGFAPEADTQVTKTFENGGLLELQSVEMLLSFDGEDHELVVEEEGSIEIGMSVEFTDTYGAMKDGQLASLTRTFGALTDRNERTYSDDEGEMVEEEESGESALSGAQVSFVWDADQEGYKLKFTDDTERDADEAEALLEGLIIEADFTYLLPKDEVEVGDTWELPATVFDQIGNPGGNLKIWVDGEEDEDQEEFDEGFTENLEGAIECKWSEVEEGKATILLSGTITSFVETEFDTPEEAPEDLEISNKVEFEFEVEGKLIWDLEKKRAFKFSIEGPLTMTNTFEQSGGDAQVKRVEVYEGTYYDRAQFE